MLAACLFDLDGVLVDTAKHHYTAWKQLAEDKIGVSFTHEDNEALKGLSRAESLFYILSKTSKTFSESEQLAMMEEKNINYLSLVSQLTPSDLLPGALSLLNSLKTHGIKCALGSASKNAPLIIEKLGIVHLLDAVVDGNVVTLSKPNPAVFLKGAEILNVSPDQTVVFEDAVSGVAAAKTGGFYCVGIGEPEALPQADYVVNDLSFVTIEDLNKKFFN
jgi:beta-phosphoglucomutase